MANEIIRRAKGGFPPVPTEIRAQRDLALSRIERLERDKDRVEIPEELWRGGLLLLVLLTIGTLLPLWELGAPDNGNQSWLLLPWAGVVAGFGLLMYSKRAPSASGSSPSILGNELKESLLKARFEAAAVEALGGVDKGTDEEA